MFMWEDMHLSMGSLSGQKKMSPQTLQLGVWAFQHRSDA